MNEQIISAKVNPRLLTKASRLFTGSIDGRVIEILQNARRAGATEVRITNKNNLVKVKDNGSGIQDFHKLLDLGGSGWDEKLEAGEDPAGVGLFCLAPRQVTIISENSKLIISKHSWTGTPVTVTKSENYIKGTILEFNDEKPWDMDIVEKHAIFAGIRVIVDGKYCHSMPFCSNSAVYYDKPGCRIEVTKDISKYHSLWTSPVYYDRVLVNFHGQVIQIDDFPNKSRQSLSILVDITDQTDIRLMLPARTRLVENQAYKQLMAAIEVEYYRYFQRQKSHTLYYEDYLRAKKLGIELQEAQPQFRVGLLSGDSTEPVEIAIPKNFKVTNGYLCCNADCNDDTAETNAHLLAALGEFKDKSFIPVTIDDGYMGYSWTKLPKVTKVEVIKENEKLRHSMYCGEIVCFDKLTITVQASNGQTFSSNVDMAVFDESQDKSKWYEHTICVTKDARKHISSESIWFHFGGYSDEGDSYDTQLYDFEKELDEFWNELIGPYETVRQQLIRKLSPLYEKWQKITIFSDESLEIVFKDGRRQRVNRPADSD
ncbi:MAG: hypothetical protein A2Y10_16510 [Planctomycetes bacterium GWF2_41_51]|nr:MAG: hypothetical protein A2Y10_16510 [Planctomycetes bacterium GWF2_41_51]HBG27923.1 hypothetical protein [Phycisphaerales bacterium]